MTKTSKPHSLFLKGRYRRKNLLRIAFPVIVSVILFSASCEEEKPDLPNNPLNGRTTAVFNPQKKYGTVIDVDGNIYKTIKIGSQTWMAENLRVTRYRNGEEVPNVTGDEQWAGMTSGAYCNYNNTSDLDTIATYGRLYNWYATSDDHGIAPKGWRVPSVMDWEILIEYLGGDTIASNKMKEKGALHWGDPFQSDNSSGFTALPGGRRQHTYLFNNIGYYGDWWTSTENNEHSAAFLYFYYFDSLVWKGFNYKFNGYSIRCIKE